VLSALTTFGKSIRDLKLERDPPEVDDLGDGITAPEVIRDVHLIPGFWKVDGYHEDDAVHRGRARERPRHRSRRIAHHWAIVIGVDEDGRDDLRLFSPVMGVTHHPSSPRTTDPTRRLTLAAWDGTTT
jgi:hypothetical protein